MIKNAFLLALTISTTIAAATFGTDEGQVFPHPGSIQVSVNATSIDNIFKTFIPILTQYKLKNQTFDVGIEKSTSLYDFKFNKFTVNEITGFTEKSFEYVNGTDVVHVKVGGVDVKLHTDALLTALKYIPFNNTMVKITNLTVEFDVKATSPDNVHWELVESSKLKFDTIEFIMENLVLDELVRLSRSIIDQLIRYFIVPKAENYFSDIIKNFNAKLDSRGPTDFEIPFGYDNTTTLNLTTTTAPAIKGDTNRLIFNFDGLVDMRDEASYQGFRRDIKNYAPILEHSKSEQIWVHENTIDSYLMNAKPNMFPMEIHSKEIFDIYYKHFGIYIKYQYGIHATCFVKLDIESGDYKPVTFDMKHGATLGQNVTATVDLICSGVGSRPTSRAKNVYVNDTALSFTTTNIILNSKTSIKDFVLSPSIERLQVSKLNTNITKCVFYRKYFGGFFNAFVQNGVPKFAQVFNDNYKQGFPLANLDPRFNELKGLLKNFEMSTQVVDQYMLFGLELQAGLPTAAAPEVEHLNFLE